MAASLLRQMRTRSWAVAHHRVTTRLHHYTPPSRFSKLLLKLSQTFYDIEYLFQWSSKFKTLSIRQKNAFYGYTQKHYGVNIAAAYCILCLGGGFRFTGQSEWIRADSKGKFSYDFLNAPNSTIEEIDLSGTLINSDGLDNMMSQQGLRSLRVQGCPQVDDWFLARLHVFGETLQDLDVSQCPRVTVGGLAALQHLRNLRRLDVSSLRAVSNPGLVRILLEEMLPACRVIGAEYEQGLIHPEGVEEVDGVEQATGDVTEAQVGAVTEEQPIKDLRCQRVMEPR